MPNYRRLWVPGGTYFFTVNLLDRRRPLLVERIDALGDAFGAARSLRPFAMPAQVVLPDHLHCIRVLPQDDADIATRWRHVKTAFARAVPDGERRSARRLAKGERGIWQRRYWEHVIRDEADFRTHVDDIHYNPVKHGWAETAAGWPYSSFGRYVARGWVRRDWGVKETGEAGRDQPYGSGS